VDWPTNRIYPPVAEDSWYERFVSIPLAPQADPVSGGAAFNHPIRIGLYMPTKEGADPDIPGLEQLLNRTYGVRPPLLFPAAVELAAQDRDPRFERLAEATPILLEGPVLYALGPPTPDTWNYGILVRDLAESVPVRGIASSEVEREAPLDNVFLEISLLETARWEQSGRAAAGWEQLRGIWLVREEDHFLVTVLTQQLPSSEEVLAMGPIPIRYDPRSRGFQTQPDPVMPVWLPLADVARPFAAAGRPDVARIFPKALSILRSLSPGWKISHLVSASFGSPEGTRSLVQVQWALADVVTLRSLGGPLAPYHVLRIFDTNEVFLGGVPTGSPTVAGTLTISGQAFGEIDPDELARSAAADLAALGPPERT
jgi:hypothetical protein